MKCFILLATLIAAASAEAGAEADPGYFASGYGAYGYPGYGAFHGYARPLLGSAYATHAYHPAAAYQAYNNIVPAVPHAAYPAVHAPIHAAAPAYAAHAIAAPAVPVAEAIAPAAYATPAIHAAPVAAIAPAAPIAVAAAPAGPVSSQYHAQDELGNYEYSYSNINSAKHESGNAHTGVKGTYSYVDGLGIPQRVDYVADDFGFRATGTNFPTTAANLGLHRKRRSAQFIASALPYAAPAIAETVSAPAAHEAILTRIQLNPGHATAYRVF